MDNAKEDQRGFFFQTFEVEKAPGGYTSYFCCPAQKRYLSIGCMFVSEHDMESQPTCRAGVVRIDVLSEDAVVIPKKRTNLGDAIAGAN